MLSSTTQATSLIFAVLLPVCEILALMALTKFCGEIPFHLVEEMVPQETIVDELGNFSLVLHENFY